MKIDYYIFAEALTKTGYNGGINISYADMYDIKEDEIKATLPESVSWESYKAKQDEVVAAYPMKRLRQIRDDMLRQTDWWAVSDRTMTSEQLAYRQALRDITIDASPGIDETGNLTGVVFPVKP